MDYLSKYLDAEREARRCGNLTMRCDHRDYWTREDYELAVDVLQRLMFRNRFGRE